MKNFPISYGVFLKLCFVVVTNYNYFFLIKFIWSKKSGEIVFKDYPDFRPNLTPREIFKLGSFGGTYWRPIYSSVTKKHYKNKHKNYPKSWWKNISENHLSRSWNDYDKSINKYNVKVGTTLEFWQEKKWITKNHPYGWIQWYCDFYNGKRRIDDQWQISRWIRNRWSNSPFEKN